MTNEQITAFFQNSKLKDRIVKIDFKTRASIVGLFIDTKDSAELNGKNFWRIISEPKIKQFFADQDTSVARIFNGNEFTRLSLPRSAV